MPDCTTAGAKGYLAIILHAHLPFVRHPEYDTFLEEDWFFEALTECYIPLLQILEGWERDKIDFRLTLSLSPPLLAMLADPVLQQRYIAKLDKLIELSTKEIRRTRHEPVFQRLARHYHRCFNETRRLFTHQYGKNIIQAFSYFSDNKKLELITCSATHAYLPVMNNNRTAIRTQIKVAVDHFNKLFGKAPQGIWLPECGFVPGVDEILRECGIGYFFLETHGIMHACPRPRFGVFAPLRCPSGVAAFGREATASKQVWSAHHGYPGDPVYREFYRDIGRDLEYEYIKPYLHNGDTRVDTGIKYYRITGDTVKRPYDPTVARRKALDHAADFVLSRVKQVEQVYALIERPPVVVAAFDAELFGHWWYEGPQWLDFVVRRIAADRNTLRLITPSHYLDLFPCSQVATPSVSSWGWNGYHESWLDESNDWIYPNLHKAAEWMEKLAQDFAGAEGLARQALNQALRELLLAQSSDWAFMMKAGTTPSYAVKRTETHLAHFFKICNDLQDGCLDKVWLNDVSSRHNIFPELDYRLYIESPSLAADNFWGKA